MNNTILDSAKRWLSDTFDAQTQQEIQNLIQNDPKELEDRFYQDLAFGTGGMRGVMGVGTNRINKYTLGKNTQGLSNYLKKVYPNEAHKVVIAYDCRHNSDTLAQTVAEVFSANGIQVYLFEELRTTPELSFSVRHLDCHVGIVLTASHNPPEYNGYKVYWTDGGQIVPPQDGEIIAEINALDFSDVQFEANPKLITKVGKEIDEVFFNASVANGDFKAAGKEDFHIVFTSLHGTSITAIPEVLKRAGYTKVTIIEEQAVPNGDFPTVQSPNPEEPEALTLALKKADEVGADMVVGTDPDSDRLGIAVRDQNGEMVLLNGNQTMLLMTKFLLDQRKSKGFKGNEFIASTIVSTPMMQTLAHAYGVECKVSLTGFKWIAKMIKDFPEQDFVGGGEESFGFMVGDFVRDKDAVTSTLLACEIGAAAKARGNSFYQDLLECYTQFGHYQEKLISITKKGMDGAQAIKDMMANFRSNPIDSLDGIPVVRVEDYSTGVATNLLDGSSEKMDIPASNVLIFIAKDGTRMAARPSGTEPKIKFYFSTNGVLSHTNDYDTAKDQLHQKIDRIIASLNLS